MQSGRPISSSAQPRRNPGQTSSFARALLEAGGHVVQSAGQGIASSINEAVGSVFGAGSGQQPNTQNQQNQPTSGEQKLENGFDNFDQFGDPTFNQELGNNDQELEWKRRERRILRHREIQQTEVYDARKVETTRKIEQILAELQALAKDLDAMNAEAKHAQIAIMQTSPDAGDYHLNFFQQLLKVVMLLRKRVQESTTWLQSFNARRGAKKGYWNMFHTQGTQWSMSHERAIATSVG